MSPGFSPSNSAVIDMDGNPFWIVSSESWLPRLFSGVTMKVIPSSCNIGSQNVIVFPEPITEIDTMLFLASNLNATLHCQMQAQTWNWALLSSCNFQMSDSRRAEEAISHWGTSQEMLTTLHLPNLWVRHLSFTISHSGLHSQMPSCTPRQTWISLITWTGWVAHQTGLDSVWWQLSVSCIREIFTINAFISLTMILIQQSDALPDEMLVLLSCTGSKNMNAVVSMTLFTQFWYWNPLAHCTCLAFVPTAIICVTPAKSFPLSIRDMGPSLTSTHPLFAKISMKILWLTSVLH